MKRTREKSRVLIFFFGFFAHIFSNITPSTISVDSVNHTYTGTLSSSTYSGYKLAANSNKIVSAGDHTLSGYTGNNITLAISGNSVSVKNTKTSTNRTTELQNFIKSEFLTNSNYNRVQGIVYKDSIHYVYTRTTRSSIISKPVVVLTDTLLVYNGDHITANEYIIASFNPIGYKFTWIVSGGTITITLNFSSDYTIVRILLPI